MTKSLHSALTELGVSELAARVYVQLLKQDELNISRLAEELGSYRRKVYDSIAELEHFKLCEKNPKTGELELKSPATVVALLAHKQAEIHKDLHRLESELPVLLGQFYQIGRTPQIRVFEGLNDFRYLFNTILDELQPGTEILSFNEGDDFYAMLDKDYFFEVWIEKRIQKQVYIRILASINNSSFYAERVKDALKLRQSRMVPSDFGSGCWWVMGHTVIFWDTLLPKAIVIDNPVIANLMQVNFESLWKISKH